MANFLADMAPALGEMRQGLMGIAQLQRQQRLSELQEGQMAEMSTHHRELERVANVQLGMTKETHTENIRKLQFENTARQKEEEFLNRGWDPTTEPLIQMMDSEGKQQVFERLKSTGLVNPDTMTGTQRDRQKAIAMLESDLKEYDAVFSNILKRQKVAIAGLMQERASLTEKGNVDPKKIADIDARIKAGREQWEVLDGKIREGAKRVAINQTVTDLKKMSSNIEGISQFHYLTRKYPALIPAINSAMESGDDTALNKAFLEIDKLENKLGKTVERTVDLGGEVEYIYPGGRREIKKKTVSPGTEARPGKPGEAYTSWERTIDRRMSQTMKKYGMTDVQSFQVASGQASMTDILAEMMAKKKLTKEGAAAMNAELSRIEEIRNKGLREIEAGGDPYKHLTAMREVTTPGEAVSHGGPITYEYKGGKLIKK